MAPGSAVPLGRKRPPNAAAAIRTQVRRVMARSMTVISKPPNSLQCILTARVHQRGYHREMAVLSPRLSRRFVLASGILAVPGLATEPGTRGEVFASEWKRYSDPATELDVYRLTEPAYSSMLPAFSN